MIDIDTITIEPGESKKSYKRRICNIIDNNLLEIYKRKHSETAASHYKRICEYEKLKDVQTYVFLPRHKEDHNTQSFIERGQTFIDKKKEIMNDFTDEIFKSMKQENKEELQDWLDRVNKMLIEHKSIIADPRDIFDETPEETQSRKDKFYYFRDEIRVQLLAAGEKAKYTNKINLAREQELEKIKVRDEEAKKEEAELEVEKQLKEKINKDRAMYNAFILFCISFLVYKVVITYDMFGGGSKLALFGTTIVLIPSWFLMFSQELYNKITANSIYKFIMGLLFKMANTKANDFSPQEEKK